MGNFFLLLLTSLLVFLVVIIPSNKQQTDGNKDGKTFFVKSDDEIVMRLANNQTASSLCDEFAKIVGEKTNGKINIQNYYAAVLGDENEVVTQMQFGGIDFARLSISPLTGLSKNLTALELPYLFKSNNHLWQFLNSSTGEELLNSFGDYNIQGICWLGGSPRHFYTAQKSIKQLSDLKGMKIRVQENSVLIPMLKGIGATPVPMPYSDVYDALQSGAIDGAENNLASYIASGHYKFAKYITLDGHSYQPLLLVASSLSLDKLKEEEKAMILEVAHTLSTSDFSRNNHYDDELIQKAADNNCAVSYVSDSASFQDEVIPFFALEIEKYKEIIDAVNAISEV